MAFSKYQDSVGYTKTGNQRRASTQALKSFSVLLSCGYKLLSAPSSMSRFQNLEDRISC